MANEYRTTHVSIESLSIGGAGKLQLTHITTEVLTVGMAGKIQLCDVNVETLTTGSVVAKPIQLFDFAIEVLSSLVVASSRKAAAQIIG